MISWDLGPGDVVVAHGNRLRVIKDTALVVGTDLGENRLHVTISSPEGDGS